MLSDKVQTDFPRLVFRGLTKTFKCLFFNQSRGTIRGGNVISCSEEDFRCYLNIDSLNEIDFPMKKWGSINVYINPFSDAPKNTRKNKYQKPENDAICRY